MRFRDTFPAFPANGHCLVDGQTSSGPCVDLEISTDSFTRKRRPETLVLSEGAIRSMAAHFGMVDPLVHAEETVRADRLELELALANERIRALAGTMQVFGLELPPEPELDLDALFAVQAPPTEEPEPVDEPTPSDPIEGEIIDTTPTETPSPSDPSDTAAEEQTDLTSPSDPVDPAPVDEAPVVAEEPPVDPAATEEPPVE